MTNISTTDPETGDKFEFKGFDIELNGLTHCAQQLALINIVAIRDQNKDLELVSLIRKARRYLHLVFDKAIERHTNGEESD